MRRGGRSPAPDNMIEVFVADIGPGLAPEIAARLFEPCLTTKKTGMGVVPSISRTVVEAHGGCIWVGADPAGEPCSGSPCARRKNGRPRPLTDQIVHVVDDDDAVRASLSFLLESTGLKARTFASAEQFLDACDEGMAGCIVTDVRMQQINGIELAKRLPAMGVTMPVIVMTGHGDVGLAVEAMKAGVADFLEKPFDDGLFLRAVEAALNSGVRAARRDADRRQFQNMLATLSPRETEVLHGVVEGQSNKEIARVLGISPRTVEAYRAHVMSKTNSASLSDLVRIAMLAGF